VLFDPREAIPVELEHDNRLFVVHIDRVLAIFRRSDVTKAAALRMPRRTRNSSELFECAGVSLWGSNELQDKVVEVAS
jgi:hypothetical protein